MHSAMRAIGCARRRAVGLLPRVNSSPSRAVSSAARWLQAAEAQDGTSIEAVVGGRGALIGGVRVGEQGRAGGAVDVMEPWRCRTLASLPVASRATVGAAVAAAAEAQGEWQQLPHGDRAAALRRLADAIERPEVARMLAVVDARNVGRPVAELPGDVGEEVQLTEAARGEGYSARVLRRPVGPVAAITPWNYPTMMNAWKLAPALAAGCTVVLKPSEATPLSSLALGDVITDEALLPPGVLNIVCGDGATTGAALVEHPDVAKVSFTGSVATGRAVARAAAERVRPVTLELGGKSPAIVWADAVESDAGLRYVTEWLLFGVFGANGQVCSATSRLLVERSAVDRVLGALVAAAERLVPGDPMDESTRIGPLVSQVHYDKVMAFLEEAEKDGIDPVVGGAEAARKLREQHSRASGCQWTVPPTIFAEPPLSSSLWCEEIFGPVLCVRAFDTEDEAFALANDTEFGLAAAVFSEDGERLRRAADSLRVGALWHNCSQLAYAELPWGGCRLSGLGRELGPRALDPFLEDTAVTVAGAREPLGWFQLGP